MFKPASQKYIRVQYEYHKIGIKQASQADLLRKVNAIGNTRIEYKQRSRIENGKGMRTSVKEQTSLKVTKPS